MQLAGTVVVLAAGQGTRMRSSRAKVLHPLCGRPMLGYVLDVARALDPERILVVVGHGAEEVRRWIEAEERDARIACVLQAEQKGTGHALQVCSRELERASGPVTVLYGDMPCLAPATLVLLRAAQAGHAAALVTATPARTRGFGRIRRDAGGAFRGIVEEKDASPAERALREVNVGVYVFEHRALLERLPRLSNRNAQGEFYLTDVLGLLLAEGKSVATVALEDEREAIGINTLEHLSEARAVLQERILEQHLANGVHVEDPRSTYVDHGVVIGPGTRILPCSVIRAGVVIGKDCEVGPFTHLRAGTVLEDGAEVGNFTEAKAARIGRGTKAKHLSYLGDVTIGAGANIGAGTIVANYDGRAKHHTDVGERAFVGSGSILIAPCRLGAGSVTGAGAVVTRASEIPPGEAWVGVPARPLRRGADPRGANPSGSGRQEERA
jgi:bifunctional UDP-N-acetylglucosamine pyrophosphorylase/glucosamine-1-phosphate N-acetyltransferase